MSSDNTKRWELIKEASKVADFHKEALDPTIQKALIGGGIGAAAGGASALLGEDDEEEGRGSKAMRRALIGGGLGAAAGGAYGLATDTPAAAAEPKPPKKVPGAPAGPEGGGAVPPVAQTPATPPTNDPNSPSYIPSGPETAAGPEAPAAQPEAPAAPPEAPPMPVIGPDGVMYAPSADGTSMEQIPLEDGQPLRVPEGAQVMLGEDGYPTIYITGPDGNPVELTSDMPEFAAANPPAPSAAPETVEAPAPTEGPSGDPVTVEAPAPTAGPETVESLQQQVDAVMIRMEHSRSVGAPTADDQRQLGYLLQRQQLLEGQRQQQIDRLGPNARPGPDGRMGTADDGKGPTLGEQRAAANRKPDGSVEKTIQAPGAAEEAARRRAATDAQEAARLGPNANPGPDGVMGTADDGQGESKAETGRREEAERRQQATANQAKNRLGPNARPGPDGVMGTKDDGTGLTVSQQRQLDELIKLRDSAGGQREKGGSWNVTPTPSPEEAINFGYRMAKQALAKSAGSYNAKKKKKSKKRHRQVLVGPKGRARTVTRPEEDDEKMAALRMRAIVERGTANFFGARDSERASKQAAISDYISANPFRWFSGEMARGRELDRQVAAQKKSRMPAKPKPKKPTTAGSWRGGTGKPTTSNVNNQLNQAGGG